MAADVCCAEAAVAEIVRRAAPRGWAVAVHPIGDLANREALDAVRSRPGQAPLGRRLDGAYAYRSLWDAGALVANGSDAPVEKLDPLARCARACCGRSASGRPGGPSRR